MVEYIYFVKCPNCEDEHFDAFDDAKAFACGCLSNKPVITQVEVNRNDFGECTDSTDLGTIWSWENMMRDIPNEASFSKSETIGDDVDFFNAFDDDVLDDVPDNFSMPVREAAEPERLATNKRGDYLIAADSGRGYSVFSASNVCLGGINCDDDETAIKRFNVGDLDESLVNQDKVNAKPIPEGMSIDDLVGEMEMNEDDVECTWCNELYDRGECRYEVNLGWLCGSCEAAIKSRGETLTFREGSYWDFLDEDAEAKHLTEAVRIKGYPFNYLKDKTDEEYAQIKQQILTELQLQFPRRTYNMTGDCFTSPGTIPYTKYGYAASIKDFYLTPDGKIWVKYHHNRLNRDVVDTIDEVLDGAAASNTTVQELRAICAICDKINRQNRPRLGVRRNVQISDWLTEMRNEVDLFRQHITKIAFTIPMSYSAVDVDKNDEPISEKAYEQLDRIYNRFLEDLTPALAHAAMDSGMVKDRVASEDVNRNIENRWHGEGSITFDCRIGELPEVVLQIIMASQFDASMDEDDIKALRTVSAYRLAAALIRYFGDVNFYKQPALAGAGAAEPVTESASMLETLEDAAAYRERLILCDECMTAALDEETGICINCGAMTRKSEDAETLNEGVMLPLDLMLRTGKEAFFELEKFVTATVEECKKYRDSGNYDVHSVEMPYKQGFRDKAVRQAVIDALAKEGFPGGQMVSYDDSLIYVPLTKAANGYGDRMSRLYGHGNFDNPTARGNKLAHADQAITQPNMQPKNNPHAAGRVLAHSDEAITNESFLTDGTEPRPEYPWDSYRDWQIDQALDELDEPLPDTPRPSTTEYEQYVDEHGIMRYRPVKTKQ